MKKTRYIWFLFILSFLMSACSGAGSAAPPSPTTVVVPSDTPLPLPTDTQIPTETAVPLPTATSTPQHPLQIEAMRAQQYPGSDVVIENELDPGVNYRRFYVSYLSEGLKIYALMTVPNG